MLLAVVGTGIVSGLFQPLGILVIVRFLPIDVQGRASGILALGMAAAPAIAPALGGLLADAFGWRAILRPCLPCCALALLLGLFLLPHPKDVEPHRFDWLGCALLFAATLFLMPGIADLQYNGTLAPRPLAQLAFAALLIAGFITHVRRNTSPIIGLALFRNQSFAMGSIVSFTYGFSLFGSICLIPVFPQDALGYSATVAGSMLIPGGVAPIVTTPLAGRMSDSHSPRNQPQPFRPISKSARGQTPATRSTHHTPSNQHMVATSHFLPTPPVARRQIHQREIKLQAFEREDGLVDLEALLEDVKPEPFAAHSQVYPAGVPIHLMALRLTVDSRLTVVDVQAAMHRSPVPSQCPEATGTLQRLVGCNLLKGFRRAVAERMPTTERCAHLSELAALLPTLGVQALLQSKSSIDAEQTRPLKIDGCHMWRADGALTMQYLPQWYTGPRTDSNPAPAAGTPPSPLSTPPADQ